MSLRTENSSFCRREKIRRHNRRRFRPPSAYPSRGIFAPPGPPGGITGQALRLHAHMRHTPDDGAAGFVSAECLHETGMLCFCQLAVAGLVVGEM